MKYFDKLFGYNTVRDVYRNFTRKKVADILVKHNMTKMETQDITDLLDRHHDKLSKQNRHRSDWSSLVIGN